MWEREKGSVLQLALDRAGIEIQAYIRQTRRLRSMILDRRSSGQLSDDMGVMQRV